jgi:hypothetical protein
VSDSGRVKQTSWHMEEAPGQSEMSNELTSTGQKGGHLSDFQTNGGQGTYPKQFNIAVST